MDFVKVERPVTAPRSGSGAGGRAAAPSEFQDAVNSLTLSDDDTAAAFVPFRDGEDIVHGEARIVRSLVKAGLAHPSGPFTVYRRFDSTEAGTTVTIWLGPKVTKNRKPAETATETAE